VEELKMKGFFLVDKKSDLVIDIREIDNETLSINFPNGHSIIIGDEFNGLDKSKIGKKTVKLLEQFIILKE